MIAGYDPQRVAELGAMTRHALEQLGEIASRDAAADAAMTAIVGLRRTLELSVLEAVRSIQAVDPLARAGTRSSPTDSTWYADWLRAVVVTRYRGLDDAALLAEVERLEHDVPYDEGFWPDVDDPFWARFEPLAVELAIRASTDRGFAERVVARTRDSFLVPIAVGYADFPPEVVAQMLVEISITPSAMVDSLSNAQAHGANTLLDVLAGYPDVALDILTRPSAFHVGTAHRTTPDATTLLRELAVWPTLDHEILGRFIGAAMGVPFRSPERLDDAFTVLQNLVVLANGGLRGPTFPNGLSPALAQVTVQYLPFFITSLEGFSKVNLKGFDMRDVGRSLGSYPELLDFVGALLRDPASRAILLAALPGVAIMGAGDNGPLGISPNDVADFVHTLQKAALNEQLEERLRSAKAERDAGWATDVAFDALTVATSAFGPAAVAGVGIPLSALREGTKAVLGWTIGERDLGLDSVAVSAFLLVTVGLGIGVLRSRDSARRPTPGAEQAEQAELAEEMLEQIERRLEDGSPVDEIEGLIGDFRRVVREVDEDGIMELVDRPPVLPPEIGTDRQLDVEE